MNARIEFADFKQLAPAAADALSALSNSVVDSGLANLDKQLIELLKIRASQLNGCAFCVQYHLNLARKVNLSQTKLDLVAVWREAGIFNAREKAALEWTEALTRDHARRYHRRVVSQRSQPIRRKRISVSHSRCPLHQRMEHNCDGLSVHAAGTTMRRSRTDLNALAYALFFALKPHNFCSSLLMVQLFFFER